MSPIIKRNVTGLIKLSLCGLAIVIGFYPLSLAQAQNGVREKFGAWDYRCETVAGEQGQQCLLAQTVQAEDRANSSLGVVILRPKGAKDGIFRVVAPLSVFLINGVSLKIDQVDIGRNAFFRCFPTGCLSDATLDEKLIEQLIKGKVATLVIYLSPFEGNRHLVKLTGLREGYDKLR
ncbi:MAG: invasion associated locus B family protein [Methylocystaceae bacterium]|nr:invasion associated locus B family protein [Methylocystaceae bacterium]